MRELKPYSLECLGSYAEDIEGGKKMKVKNKFLGVILIAVCFVFLSNRCEATDVWVCSTKDADYYVMTETIDWPGKHNTEVIGDRFSVYTKKVEFSGPVTKIYWKFWVGGRYTNSLNDKGDLVKTRSSVAPKVYYYCLDYINNYS